MNTNIKGLIELSNLFEQRNILNTEELVSSALIIGENMSFNQEVRSLATDFMLIAEGDFNGEFDSFDKLGIEIQKLHNLDKK